MAVTGAVGDLLRCACGEKHPVKEVRDGVPVIDCPEGAGQYLARFSNVTHTDAAMNDIRYVLREHVPA